MKSNNGLFTEERRRRILQLIRERKKVTVKQLCELFDVSHVTIRADLRDLDRDGLIVRTHGGAIEKSRTGYEEVSSQRQAQNLQAKQAIAQAAAKLVGDGDTIILDTGTTTFELARRLTSLRRLTAVTNDIQIARLLEDASGVEVVLLGGILRKGYHCMVGMEAMRTVNSLRVDKAFMGTNSFSIATGATTPDLHQSETKKAMIAIAKHVILLCDSSKLGRESFARFATVDQIDTLITEQIGSDDRRRFEDHGVEVIVAEK